MEKTTNRCMGCMAPIEPGVEVCQKCTHDNTASNPPPCIMAGSVLGERYIVGAIIHQNDLTIVYQGYDLKKDGRVYVEEFMPRAYARRDEDGKTLLVAQKDQARFTTLLSDMADRWKRLVGINNKVLFRIRELAQENGTIYSVTNYLPAITLKDYLAKQKKPHLNWNEARTLIMPLFSLISQMHNLGLVHCGICPDNVMVDEKGGLRLTGFALPELRTAGTDLPPELYAGYSAPEQYSKNLWQGEWTDIYSLGAILYYALTGEAPVSADRRVKEDILPSVAAKMPGVPDNVSAAIHKAMEVNKKNRFVSVDQFTAALLEEAGSNTAIFRSQKIEAKGPEKKSLFALGGRGIMAALAISFLVNFALLAVMATGNTLFPQPPESVPDPVPLVEYDFHGIYYQEWRESHGDLGDLIIKLEYEYNEQVAQGVVYGQSVELGAPLPEDKTITLQVSKGSRFFIMPNLEGCSETYAILLLGQLGLEWDDIRYSNDLNIPEGTVVCNVPPGTKMEVGDKVILTVRVPAEPTEETR